ncbi:hypothetical protein BX070DRAFT_233747 [Coemansia spiralis]|nr:hypothetical protein BX070DRAFT_233747 [Coemansia spiralis]
MSSATQISTQIPFPCFNYNKTTSSFKAVLLVSSDSKAATHLAATHSTNKAAVQPAMGQPAGFAIPLKKEDTPAAPSNPCTTDQAENIACTPTILQRSVPVLPLLPVRLSRPTTPTSPPKPSTRSAPQSPSRAPRVSRRNSIACTAIFFEKGSGKQVDGLARSYDYSTI